MSIKFPKPETCCDHIRAVISDGEFRDLSIMAQLLVFQADTIAAMADYLIAEARKFELANQTITFAQLKLAGEKLREYAQTVAPLASCLAPGEVKQ
jgi:hypothetical protein